MCVTHPGKSLSTGNDLRETSQNNVPQFTESWLKHNLGLLNLQFDDHDLFLHIGQLIVILTKIIASLRGKRWQKLRNSCITKKLINWEFDFGLREYIKFKKIEPVRFTILI